MEIRILLPYYMNRTSELLLWFAIKSIAYYGLSN